MENKDRIEAAKIAYNKIVSDILARKNFLSNLRDIESAIRELDNRIEDAKRAGNPYKGYELLKSEILFLKNQVSERP